MKKLLFFAIALAMVGCGKDDNAGSKSDNLPPLPDADNVCSAMDDTAFAQFCLDKFDTNHDGKLSPEEAAAVTEIIDEGNGIKSFKGIEYFTALRKITCSYNSDVKRIDLRYNTQMTTIAESAFEACYGLEEVILPPTLRTIADSAFIECESLKAIDLPDTVTTIDDLAFDGCIALTSITLPSKLATIGECAFSGCENLSGVITIPDSVVELGNATFIYCTALESATLGKGITEITEFMFQKCKNLKDITIAAEAKITLIGDSAFSDCSSLTKFVAPDTVTEIENAAFYRCSALSSMTIGKATTTIGNNVFYQCLNLFNVYCKATTPPQLGDKVFDSNPATAKIYVPKGSGATYKAADGWKNFASNIEEIYFM